MIGSILDWTIAAISPVSGVRRAQARKMLRTYHGAEPNRFTNNAKPQNRSADSEMLGPWGADNLRAWARMLVRDNAYAWGVVDTIVSSVVGCGIITMSMVENADGDDDVETNEARDDVWNRWVEVCDINGEYDFYEMQALAQREIVEGGECLLHMVNVPTEFRGISRPVPLALELIEADRLATEKDTFRSSADGVRIVRGIELDELGGKVAYWVYPEAPTAPGIRSRTPVRIPAANILHLYRKDRIGQTRGVSWFAPVLAWVRDLGTYMENELQASAVASCYTAAIKTEGPTGTFGATPSGEDGEDVDGNTYDFMQPAAIFHLRPGEDIQFGDPGRPNSGAEPWINLLLRGIAVGTGLSFETVARDYSKTNYSANRASQLEDRRRFRCWQRYLKVHLCCPVRDRFHEAAALAGLSQFPTMAELLADKHAAAPVEFQATGWEWVDPAKEQKASSEAIATDLSTYADELGAKGKNWRSTLRQRAKEQRFRASLGMKDIAANPQQQQPQEQESQEVENGEEIAQVA